MTLRTLIIFLLFGTAASLPAADPESTVRLLERAQSLASSKRFDEAARIYIDLLHAQPASREPMLGLARIRLWQGRYREARQLFEGLLARNRNDADAAEGAATAAYWSGDFRTAQREFREIVKAHPGRKNVRRSLDELRSASASIESIDVGLIDDDQPFHAARSEARASMFTDPLTRWDVSVGAYGLNSDIGGHHGVPFAIAGNETVIPSKRLTATLSLGAIRTPNGRTRPIGGASGRIRFARNDSVTAAFARREILSNATQLYPFVDIASIRWLHTTPWLASIGTEHDRFSDRNSANAADGYILAPAVRRKGWTLWAGASALFRDTTESRFYVNGITATRDPSGGFFRYSYRGAYDPYWTPHDLLEGRVILALEHRIGSTTTMKIQGDGGRARDRAVMFWPDTGPTSFPREIGQSPFDRTYRPWRLRFTSTTALAKGITLDLSVEHSVTTFYRANSFHAALARRR
ncbi:MAG TPA: tetratricopeptide repeat protein [Thermoanaerobaculia bacterium]